MLSRDEIVTAVSGGWTTKENEEKTMDIDLATAIVRNIEEAQLKKLKTQILPPISPAELKEKAKVDVYNREECIYQYCPLPSKCKEDNKCQNPRKVT